MALSKADVIHNESVKLIAEACSNLAVAVAGTGVLGKLVAVAVTAGAPPAAHDILGTDLLVWAAVSLYLHVLGQWALRDLRA